MMVTLKLNHQPSGGKEWVARVIRVDGSRIIEREFLRWFDTEWSVVRQDRMDYVCDQRRQYLRV